MPDPRMPPKPPRPPPHFTATGEVRIIEARNRVVMGWQEIVGLAVVAVLMLATQILGKQYSLEVSSVTTLLAWYVGKRTGQPAPEVLRAPVIEQALRRMPRVSVDQLYERVTGRPPRPRPPPL